MIPASLGPLAQVVEQEAFNLCVIGSNPIRPTSLKKFFDFFKGCSIKNLITRAVGAHEFLDVELHVHPSSEQDLYLLCSDGLTDMLGNDEICSILDQCGHNLQAACNVLVQAANLLGGNDNISVILFQLDPENKKAWVARKKSR